MATRQITCTSSLMVTVFAVPIFNGAMEIGFDQPSHRIRAIEGVKIIPPLRSGAPDYYRIIPVHHLS